MPQVAYDFSKAEDFAEFTTLENGRYVLKFVNADATQKSKSGGKKVVIDLIVTAAGAQEHSWAEGGLVRQHWPTEGPASGRFRDFMIALGINLKAKAKGGIKLEKHYGTEVGANSTKTAGKQTDAEGNVMYFNELSRIMPGEQMRQILGLGDAEEEEEEPDEDEEVAEDEDEGEEEEEDSEEEDEDSDEESENEEEEGEELTFEDLASMSLADLKALAVENKISVKPPKDKKLTSALLRKRLAPLFEAEEEEGEEDPF